jgi:hypothetical protein
MQFCKEQTMKRSQLFAGLAALACLASATPASATLVTSRVALGGTDFIDWGQLSDAFFFVDEPAAVVTNNGLNAVAHGSGSGFERDDEGAGWAGDFARGDKLLVTVGTPRIDIEFDSLLKSVGVQIQDSSIDFSFIGFISAFDALGNLLETHSLGSVSLSRQNNSAIFLGITRDTADIASVLFGTNTGRQFAINRLDLTPGVVSVPPTEPPPTAVPEPDTLAVSGLALMALAFVRRRKELNGA